MPVPTLEKETKIEKLKEGMAPGWRLVVDGKEIKVSEMAVLYNEKIGHLSYGKSPSGDYDQWGFHEVGGGGSVIIPYSIIDDQIFVGVVEQLRPFQSASPVLNVPRGFLDPEKDHFQSAKDELGEEFGLSDIEIINLGGEGGNPNNAFFETWGSKEGIKFWAVKVPPQFLEKDANGSYQFKEGSVKPETGDKMAERILGAKLISLSEASDLGDMMTLAAVTRLLNHFLEKKEITIYFNNDPKDSNSA